MKFIRWYSRFAVAGFFLGLFINPAVTIIGFGVWLALVFYLSRRIPEA